MFTPDAQVLDFSAQDWLRLPDLFRTPGPAAPAPQGGGILAVREGQRLVKVTSTLRGRLPLPDAGLVSAATLGKLHDGSFAVVFSKTALRAASASMVRSRARRSK